MDLANASGLDDDQVAELTSYRLLHPTEIREARESEPDVVMLRYDEHDLEAAKLCRAMLDLGLEARGDRAMAHKYLAFIVCVRGREKACRDQFRKALEADPSFELEPAEAGNPIWRAALRNAKAERAKAKSK